MGEAEKEPWVIQPNILTKILALGFTAIGHPGIFWVYLQLFAEGTLGSRSVKFLGIETFHLKGGNVTSLEFIPFLLFSQILYFLWIVANIAVIKRLQPSFSLDDYLGRKIIPGAFICVFGLLHLLCWLGGMEGNIFGFLLFPLLAMLGLVSAVIYLFHMFSVISSKW